MNRTPKPKADSSWLPRPRPINDPGALATYLSHYGEWLDGVATAIETASGRFHDPVGFVALVTFCADKVQALTPWGHGTDAEVNGYSTLAQWLSAQAWAEELAGREALAFLGGPEVEIDHHRIKDSGVIPAVVTKVGRLHVTESVVRQDAMSQLIALGADLPRVASKPISRDGLKSGLGQKDSRDAFVATITSVPLYWNRVVHPPVAAMQRAWLSAVWPSKREKVLADASNEEPHIRFEALTWIERIETLHPWLVSTNDAEGTLTSAADPTPEEWHEYVTSQLNLLAASVFTATGVKTIRHKHRFDPEDVVAEAFDRASEWMLRAKARPLDTVGDNWWRKCWQSSLKSAREDYWKSLKEQSVVTGIHREDSTTHEDESDRSASPLTDLHLHLGRLFLIRVAAGEFTIGEAERQLVATVTQFVTDARDARDSDYHEVVVRLAGSRPLSDLAESLADEVLFHLAETPGRFRSIGESTGSGESLIKGRITRYAKRRFRDEQPGGEP